MWKCLEKYKVRDQGKGLLSASLQLLSLQMYQDLPQGTADTLRTMSAAPGHPSLRSASYTSCSSCQTPWPPCFLKLCFHVLPRNAQFCVQKLGFWWDYLFMSACICQNVRLGRARCAGSLPPGAVVYIWLAPVHRGSRDTSVDGPVGSKWNMHTNL